MRNWATLTVCTVLVSVAVFRIGVTTGAGKIAKANEVVLTDYARRLAESAEKQNELSEQLRLIERLYDGELYENEALRNRLDAGSVGVHTYIAPGSCRLPDPSDTARDSARSTARLDDTTARALFDFRRDYLSQLAELATCRAFVAKLREG